MPVSRFATHACVLLLVFAGGCGYMVGGAFDYQVRTVAVPVFKSETNRRDLEYLLTEAVQKEIQTRTHFRLVRADTADTVLHGRIIDSRKDVLGITAFDDPRELQNSLVVEVRWEDRRNGRVHTHHLPIRDLQRHLSAQTAFAPEVGQSQATATDAAVRELATSIVDMMETPW
ncbi:MAG: LptE family protein [Planctomycetota bacterium]|nr:LptE family protein [Planctomycetota bacterium]